jgi:transcriptional regulator with XRE-family HTH domain
MNRQTYHNTSSNNSRLRSLFLNDPELIGEMVDASICNNIAFDLYSLRTRLGLTQARLAALLGVKQSNISRWETPGYQGYKVKVLSRIARALKGRLTVTIKPIATFSGAAKLPVTAGLDDTNVFIHTWGNHNPIATVKSEEFSYANN